MLYNTHVHILNKDYIPERFLPLKLMRLLARNCVGRGIARFLNLLLPFSSNDLLDRYANFIRVAGKKSQFEIFQQLFDIYVKFCEENKISINDLRFVILTMDMEFMEAGKTKKSFEEQLEEVAKLAINPAYGDLIIPFMFIDPRREDIDALVEKYIIRGVYKGAKMYPPIGYFPDDDRLARIYYQLEQAQKPIITHCSQGGIYLRSMKQTECEQFTWPINWIPVLENYPKLKICFAHMGGEQAFKDFFIPGSKGQNYINNWFYLILEMLKKFPNLYVDISYTFWKFEYFPILKLLLDNSNYRNKLLFGTDFFMILMDTKETRFLALKDYLGEEDWKQITETNPKRFFNSSCV